MVISSSSMPQSKLMNSSGECAILMIIIGVLGAYSLFWPIDPKNHNIEFRILGVGDPPVVNVCFLCLNSLFQMGASDLPVWLP